MKYITYLFLLIGYYAKAQVVEQNPIGGLEVISASTSPLINTITAPTGSIVLAKDGSGLFYTNNGTTWIKGLTEPTWTNGSVLFGNSGIGQDNNLFWDNTNKRLGIGSNIPLEKFHIQDGALLLNTTLNLATRPIIGTSNIAGEIHAVGGSGNDWGLLRLSAGGMTNPAVKSWVDIMGFSTTASDNGTIVMGTAGAEKMRITNSGNVGIATNIPARKLEVAATMGTAPMRFTNMTSTSATLPTPSGNVYPLYVDANGDVMAKAAQSVTNELFFEDGSYHYVSMKINTSNYKVVRYDKNNLNVEAQNSGTGTQPATLSAVQALTYN